MKQQRRYFQTRPSELLSRVVADSRVLSSPAGALLICKAITAACNSLVHTILGRCMEPQALNIGWKNKECVFDQEKRVFFLRQAHHDTLFVCPFSVDTQEAASSPIHGVPGGLAHAMHCVRR